MTVHSWLLENRKVVFSLLGVFLVCTIVGYCFRETNFVKDIIGYFAYWEKTFVSLCAIFVAYTGWVVLGYIKGESEKKRGESQK
jgi:hypothetical protein